MNLTQLRTQIDRRTGKAQDVSAANSYINEAINQISSRREWPWLDAVQTVTIAADINGSPEPTFTVPSSYSETRTLNVAGHEAQRIYIADGDSYAFYEDWHQLYQFTIEANSQIKIFPNPPIGTTVVHRYTRTEPLLSADTGEPIMPERYHSLIADLAAALFLERVDMTRAEYYHDRYEKGQKQMFEAVQRQSGPARIRVRRGLWNQ